MKAEEISVGRLYEAGHQVLIPLWQRRYSWELDQWSELWGDIQRVRKGAETSHFVGSIVLHRLPWSGLPSEAHRYWVVDGQQRITTLTILMCALRDRLALLEETEEAGRIASEDYTSQLLVNTNLKPEYRPRLVLQESDRHSIQSIIEGTLSGRAESRIERSYAYFRDQLQHADATELREVMTVTLTRLSAVWVTLDHEDNAHRVFQTLNAGGRRLRQSDLVRNYFFLLLGDEGEQFYRDHWRAMEKALDERSIDDFFVAWSVSQGHSGSTGSLFSYFNKDLRDYESSLVDVLHYGQRMIGASRLFRFLRSPQDSNYAVPVRRTLLDLRNWGTIPADGLILWLMRSHATDDLNDQQFQACLEIVLSFMARRQLAGYEPNLHKSIFTTAARKLNTSGFTGEDLADYLRFVLSEGSELKIWPSDDEVQGAATTASLYSRARTSWTFSILERIDRGLYDHPKHAPAHVDRQAYSIEHILPQTLTSSWVQDLETWGVASPHSTHGSRLHTLGNLSLTPINSELGNQPFSIKRAHLVDDSLRLNQYFAEATTWTGSRIEERSNALAKVACSQYVSPLRSSALDEARTRFAVIARATADITTEEESGE